MLQAEALLRKRDGDTDGAVESCLTAFKLVRRMGDEPMLIQFLVQGAIFAIAQRTLWQVLSDADASPKAYRQVLAELKAWDIDRYFVQVLQMERVLETQKFDWLRSLPPPERGLTHLFDESINNLVWYLRSHKTLLAENELVILRYHGQLIALARKGAPYDRKALQRLKAEVQQIMMKVRSKARNEVECRQEWDEVKRHSAIASWLTTNPL